MSQTITASPTDFTTTTNLETRRKPVFELVFWSAMSCALSILNRDAGLLVPIPKFGTVPGHIASILFLAAILFSLLSLARASAQLRVSSAFQITAGLVFGFPVLLSILSGVGESTAVVASSAPFQALVGIMHAIPATVQFFTSNLLGPLGMVLLGAGVGRLIRHPNTLLAGAAFAIFFDIVVVTMGTVAQLIKRGSDVISAVSVGAGGSSGAAGRVLPLGTHIGHVPAPVSTVTIGPADILFLAFFLAAVYTNRLSPRATFAWMFTLLLSALILVETTALPIPALAPMGVSVLIANARFAAFTRTEKRDLFIGAGFALFCALAMIGGARRLLPSPPPRFGFIVARLGENGPFIVQAIGNGSPAQKAGLLPGDLIVSINGARTRGMTEEQFTTERQNSAKAGMSVHIRRRGDPSPHDLLLVPDAR